MVSPAVYRFSTPEDMENLLNTRVHASQVGAASKPPSSSGNLHACNHSRLVCGFHRSPCSNIVYDKQFLLR